MAQARELDYPRWATDGGASVVEPNEGRKDTGFEADDEADEAEFNWLHRTTYRWARFLDESHCGREFRGTTSWYEPAFGYVAGAGLTAACGPGVVCREGTRLELDADLLASIGETTHDFPASRDTYVFVDDERALTFTDVANGGPAPATPAGTTRLFIVVTDGANVTSVTRSLLDGPIMAPSLGLRVSPRLIVGLNGGVPEVVHDVGTGGAGATLGSVRSALSGGTTYVDRTWIRATNVLTDLLLGAGMHVSTNDTTNAATKTWQWSLGHYTNAEQPVGLVRGVSGVATSTVAIGGGDAAVNAATSVQLWAAANNTTTTGTLLVDVQGATGLVHLPVGLLNLGDGSGVGLLRINRGSPAAGEGGIEVQEAGSRRWLADYSPNSSDDLVWWRFNGGADQGVSLRLEYTTGRVQVETDAGLYVLPDNGSTTRGIRIATHQGAEGGTYDAEEFELKTKVVETNTNGNEDLILITQSQMPSDGVFMIEVCILGVEDTDVLGCYGRRQTSIYLRDGGAGVSFSHSVEDTGVAGGSASWGGGPASAGLSISGTDIILRVTANNTDRRNWTVLVRWGRTRAFNS